MILPGRRVARWVAWIAVGGATLGLLAACSGFNGFEIDLRHLLTGLQASPTPAPAPTLPVLADVTPAPLSSTLPPVIEPSPTPERQVLILWLPPELDPSSDTTAGKILMQRLDLFAQENGLPIQVRIKAGQGPGGMLDALTAAGAAAPGAMPALVALPRSDLETAALKGLVYSLDGLTAVFDDPDWYPYAQQLAKIQGATFGLPFGGDALLLLYRPARLGPPPAAWEDVFRLGQPLAFPAADPQAMLTLDLYLSAGGVVEDEQRRPMVDLKTLQGVLQMYAEGGKTGVFPYWLSQVQSDSQAWQAYNEQRAQWLVTWSSQYLKELPADTTAVTLLGAGDQPLSLASGWVWALSDPLPDQRAASVKLAEYLVDPSFLAEWTRAVGMLPPRPSALGLWSDATLRSMLTPVVLSAQLRPPNDLMASLGPALESATLQVIKRETDPAQAAQAAFDRLALQKTK